MERRESSSCPKQQQPKKKGLAHISPDSQEAEDVRARLMTIAEASPPLGQLKETITPKDETPGVEPEDEEDVRGRLVSISYVNVQPVEN
ncbi:hypothetical protein R1flu_014747 [Riccia fluitans]|uniref:Uncharacterized protein n=1 Tax=Riccia fluitans TaxID=41844 RepID=A0ABD1YGZ9_9MARC